MLNKRTLVLEGVTLGGVVKLVVKVLVDLAAGAVLDEQPTENPLAAHPDDLTVYRIAMSAKYSNPAHSKQPWPRLMALGSMVQK